MSQDPHNENLPTQRRILTLDDNPDILSDYRKVLLQETVDENFAAIEASLFSTTAEPSAAKVKYQIDSANQGQEGLEMVRASIESKRPYSCAFIDCLLYTSPSPRDLSTSRMPSSA